MAFVKPTAVLLLLLFVHSIESQELRNETYERIPSSFLDDVVVYNLIEMDPSADKEFLDALYAEDQLFHTWTEIYKAQSKHAMEEFSEMRPLSDYAEIARLKNAEISDLLDKKYNRVTSAIESVNSTSARAFLNQTYLEFRDLRYKISNRAHLFSELLKVANTCYNNVLSSEDIEKIKEAFPSFEKFWKDRRTKVLLEKRKFCSEEMLFEEMTDEAAFIAKNGFPTPEEILRRRIGTTTVMCHSIPYCEYFEIDLKGCDNLLY
ncbi:hypothetical protein QR680_013761 [Steinernema hermaphroditum]|uniref:Uncharacterized protein n=1 Tax=Steinernema hermaphroditum TaxID=289476 RepID=A0AA39M324_9BILA|nr:hypothetical protein QR680_013761 [Steinernema hermaphroditum]